MFVCTIAIPSSGGESIRGFTHQTARVPVGNGFSKLVGEVGATVDDPAHGFGARGRREDAGAQSRIRSSAPKDVFYGRFGRWIFDLIWSGWMSMGVL